MQSAVILQLVSVVASVYFTSTVSALSASGHRQAHGELRAALFHSRATNVQHESSQLQPISRHAYEEHTLLELAAGARSITSTGGPPAANSGAANSGAASPASAAPSGAPASNAEPIYILPLSPVGLVEGPQAAPSSAAPPAAPGAPATP